MATERDMIAAWQWAADDLGIEITSPFVVGDEEFPVHVPLFGRRAGALPIWIADQRCRREARFNTTHWSIVLAAGQGSSSEAQSALGTLCETYWYPLYAFVRHLGYHAEEA